MVVKRSAFGYQETLSRAVEADDEGVLLGYRDPREFASI